jgi:hypothetical protein
MAQATTTRVGNPHLMTRGDPVSGRYEVHGAAFTFYVGNMQKISNEFDIPKSNEKGVTILRGCKAMGSSTLAAKLKDHTFLLDRLGRELPPGVGKFSPEVIAAAETFTPNANNERHEDNLTGDVFDATKYKLLLKSLLPYGRLMYTNEGDDNLLLFRVETDASAGEGLIEAIFRAGAEDRDIFMSLTETTNFQLMES